MTQRILVWDLPTRIFHWTLAVSFAVAFLTGESERWLDFHVLLGYTVLGLIAFRLVWGFVGTRYVRFAELMRSVPYVVRYLAQLLRGHDWHSVGHNPAGVVAIALLLLLGIASGVSGWAVYEEIGDDWLEELHKFISSAMLAMVFVHVAGVLVASYLHGENLIVAMITGRKRGAAKQAISSSYPLIAMLLLTALIGFWIWAWPDSRDERWLHEIGQELKWSFCFNHSSDEGGDMGEMKRTRRNHAAVFKSKVAPLTAVKGEF
jgi:cytochrome b